jgi:aerobic-type carbon monoxide dehydrogenase small subunit (CoxS/CutS family)
MANLKINGKAFDIDVEPDTPLLWVIRETLDSLEPNMAAASRNAAPALSISTAWRHVRAA